MTGSLFDVPYVAGSSTSKEAARKVTNADTQRAFVLWALDHYGPLTDEELWQHSRKAYAWKESSVRRARINLTNGKYETPKVRGTSKVKISTAGGKMELWERIQDA